MQSANALILRVVTDKLHPAGLIVRDLLQLEDEKGRA